MKKAFILYILSGFILLTACGSEDKDSKSDRISSTADSTSSDAIVSETEVDEAEKWTYKTEYDSTGKKHIYVGYERVADNEIKTNDGKFSCKYEYAVNEDENTIDITVITSNLSDEDVTVDCTPFIEIYTDLTDPDTDFGMTGAWYGTKIKAGESDVQTYTSRRLEDGWSAADITVSLKIATEPESEVEYSANGEDTGTFKFSI